MRLLFLTNFYPPASRGGYEQWCQEVTDGLRNRGHEVLVLTSTYKQRSVRSSDPTWVLRKLYLEMEFMSLRNAFEFFARRKQREGENLKILQDVVGVYKPDAILIWGMWNIPRSLPELAEKLLPGRVVYYIGDYWTTLPSQFENYWNSPARNLITGLPKLLLRPVAQRRLAQEEKTHLQLEHALFPSAFMRGELERKGMSFRNTKLIYGAINTKQYLDLQKTTKRTGRISLLYVGRLTHEKGVHTAIEAVSHLVHEQGIENLSLTIVGGGESSYVELLHQSVEREKVAPFVTFMAVQPREALPSLYQDADIFLFTSIWPEPFGRVIVEAMASGVTVIGSQVGGAAEILVDGENALTFTPGDPESLSRQLKRLVESPSLRARLALSGRETARNKFDIHRMTIEIELYLQTIIH